MRGAAERGQSDGVVTLGELFEYVRDGVLRETGNKQHPSIGTTTFDRRFPMAVTGGARRSSTTRSAASSTNWVVS